MIVSPQQIEDLYNEHKFCTEQMVWKRDDHVPYPHQTFEVNVVTTQSEQVLRWIGWFTVKHGMTRWGFKLLYRNKYEVRSWDMGSQHYSREEDGYVRGVGLHKHRYRDDGNPRDTYRIPAGEISTTDPNDAVMDFATECNIELLAGYQSFLGDG